MCLFSALMEPSLTYTYSRELSRWQEIYHQCQLVADIFSSAADLKHRARKIRTCPSVLVPVGSNHQQQPFQLRPFYACGTALCPSCHGRHDRQRKPYQQVLPDLLAAYSGADSIQATFTIQNPPIQELRSSIDHLQESFAERLLRREPFKHSIAYTRCTEVSLGSDGRPHPHIHALFLVKSGTVDTYSLPNLWQEAAKLDYPPVVHQKTKQTPARWLRYMSKPPVKITADMLADPPFLLELARQIDRAKMFTAGGEFRRFKQKLKPSSPLGSNSFLSTAHYAHGTRLQWSPAAGTYISLK